jgi:release factor glutamine methyltransferase
MTAAVAYQTITEALLPIYGDREAGLIANMVLEKLTGNRWNQHSTAILSSTQQHSLKEQLAALVQHKPVQYVLQEAWFQNMPFYVNEQVLIPRPETEELVEWVAAAERHRPAPVIADIGTGSGCIAVSLAKKFPGAAIHAIDLSTGALQVARINADRQHTVIHLHQLDFLQPGNWSAFPVPDILVSNPPYIPQSGRKDMAAHVVDHEPALALFVPEEDPMLFYTAIAQYATQMGKPGMAIFVEIHEDLARGVERSFAEAGLTGIQTRRDMQGKERMIRALKP